MLIYHGSNVEVRKPQLLKRQRDLDFGKGFYTTTDKQQAATWARRTARIRKEGSALVSVYEFNETHAADFNVLHFEAPDRAWLEFVAAHRAGKAVESSPDIVWGPVANDKTNPTLMLYLDGYLTAERTIELLLPQKLKDQIVFRSKQAPELLTCIEVFEA